MHSSPFRALAHYRILPTLIGWPALIVAFAARAPFAMVPLGTLTAVTASTGSVATGGLATAVVSLSAAVASPLIGRWADHAGQRRVLLTLTPLHATALAALFCATTQGWHGGTLWLACLAVGSTFLPIGSFTRARWAATARTPRDLGAAFSYESMADELTFVLGPALVGIAASAAAPAAPLALAIALVLGAGLPFAFSAPSRIIDEDEAASSASTDSRAGAPSPEGASTAAAAEAASTRPSISRVLISVAPSIIIMCSIGTFFGSMQTATTARATLLGTPGEAGLYYALLGLGSAVTALLVVMVPDSVSLAWRITLGGLGLGALIVVTGAQETMWATGLGLLALGMFVGPTMVTAFSIAEKLAPPGGMSVAMTSMTSSSTVGVSLGSAVGGMLAGTYGPQGAFSMALVTAIVIIAVGVTLSWVGRESSVPRRHATQVR